MQHARHACFNKAIYVANNVAYLSEREREREVTLRTLFQTTNSHNAGDLLKYASNFPRAQHMTDRIYRYRSRPTRYVTRYFRSQAREMRLNY
jgi:hypothetical protein